MLLNEGESTVLIIGKLSVPPVVIFVPGYTLVVSPADVAMLFMIVSSGVLPE